MDNVLIDDRRIHVDFSQSVAKLHGKGKSQKHKIVMDYKWNASVAKLHGKG